MLSQQLKSVASNLINQFGSDVVLTKVTIGEPNIVTGDQDNIEENHNIKAVIEDYTSHELDYEHIGLNDFKVTVVFDGDITEADKIDGAQIISVFRERAQNLDVIWTLQCRK